MTWNITRGQEVCFGCQRPFEQGQVIYSFLEVGTEEIVRRDCCTGCFESREGAGENIFWRTRKPDSEPETRRVVDFELLRDLFFKMYSGKSAALMPMTYLIGLVLIRKKYLRLVDFITHEGKDCMQVQRRRGEPYFDVEIPLLGEDEIVALKDRLSTILSTDLDDSLDLSRLEEKVEEEVEEEVDQEDSKASE